MGIPVRRVTSSSHDWYRFSPGGNLMNLWRWLGVVVFLVGVTCLVSPRIPVYAGGEKGKKDEGKKDEGKKDEGKKDEGKKDEGKKDEGKKDEGKKDEGKKQDAKGGGAGGQLQF